MNNNICNMFLKSMFDNLDLENIDEVDDFLKRNMNNHNESDLETEKYMNYPIAKFEKVSFNQFLDDFMKCNPDVEPTKVPFSVVTKDIKDIYDNIKLPERKTKYSAGYDFHLPYPVIFKNNSTITIPTGVRCKINDNYVLKIYPRSSFGFKYGMNLANTVGIIDADYYNADNEGHIMVKVYCGNQGVKTTNLSQFTLDSSDDKVIISNISNNYENMNVDDPIIKIESGIAFVQGIFERYYTAEESDVTSERTGGVGSTDK